MNKKREKIQGLYTDLLDEAEALNKVNQIIKASKSAQIITINPEMIIKASKNKDLKELINNADLIIPDGIGVKIALKLKRIKQDQIRGIDFSYNLLKLAEKEGYSVGFLGAKEEIINLAVKKIKVNMPNLKIVYLRNGYFENQD